MCLTGNGGADRFTGGLGNDTFRGTKFGLNGDTITDFSVGDPIVFIDAALAGFTFNLTGNTLNYSGGSMTLTGVTGTIVASAAPGGGVQLTLQAAASQFADASLVFTAFGSGAGAGGWSSDDLYPRLLADVNGDNRDDIVGFGSDGVYVSLAQANGSFARSPPRPPGSGSTRARAAGRPTTAIRARSPTSTATVAPTSSGLAMTGSMWRLARPTAASPRRRRRPPRSATTPAPAAGHRTTAIRARSPTSTATAAPTSSGLAMTVSMSRSVRATAPSLADRGDDRVRLQCERRRLVVQHHLSAARRRREQRQSRRHRRVRQSRGLRLARSGQRHLRSANACTQRVWRPAGWRSWTSDDLYPRRLADVDDDGDLDIVGFGNNGVFISYGNGNGGFQASIFDLDFFGFGPQAGNWTSDNTLSAPSRRHKWRRSGGYRRLLQQRRPRRLVERISSRRGAKGSPLPVACQPAKSFGHGQADCNSRPANR